MNSASKVYLLASLQVEPRDLELSMLLHGSVKFPSASFGGLENLTLRNVMVSTERFKNLRIILPNDEEFSQSLILHAPKLEWFSWAGCASNYSCEGNVEFLCHSDISIEHASIANNEYESLDNGIIGKVLQSMHRVSSMSICDVSIKEISLPELLPEFCNLLSLTLKRTNALNKITSVVLLLKSMPQLNTLKILGIPYSKEDIARFSTLSTKCRELCLTLPVLTIELGNASGKELYKFNAFSHSFTSLNNEADVHQFKAEKYGQTLGGDHHIGNWILEATKSNVENIILRFNKFKIFSLPSGLSNSACLRDLEVRMNPQGLLNLPTTSFVGLEKLKLRDVRVSTNFDEWISSCKSLKMVHLHAVTCVNTLNLSSLSLEDLILKDMLVGSPNFNIKVSAERLRNLRIVWFYAPQPSQSLTLHAPKLEQFSWGGLVSHYSCEGNLESLSKSNISIDFNDERVALGIIGQVFQSIYRVSSISICDYSIKMEKSFSSEYWESQNLKFVHSLNEVDMHISGEHNEIELIKYLLKNAKSLKMLTIRFNTRILPCERSEISKKIRQFQVASSSSAIYFFIDH
ncbi:hypothetical protein FEM48_Zijuj05G0103600 [Ziziphus jujuba var. spinosa]|uniref:FBD domain-containing protein n=1 Tax=Ziziphus jujuba var. spinosa TaxID=714518 RepID=A0A978VEE5_ZIZJJ|nr:hypothetical protein FEM48_Zijuj05G0103600 [Ziziphus jujuba var. spinosa]